MCVGRFLQVMLTVAIRLKAGAGRMPISWKKFAIATKKKQTRSGYTKTIKKTVGFWRGNQYRIDDYDEIGTTLTIWKIV